MLHWNSLNVAARRTIKSPGFAIAAVVTLALGVGATTAMFSVIHTLLLRPLPVASPATLVRVVQLLRPGASGSGELVRAGLSIEQVTALQASSRTLADVGMYGITSGRFMAGESRAMLTGIELTPALIQSLGVRAAIGRSLAVGDDAPDAEPVILLSQRTWRQVYGAAPNIVGRLATLDRVSHRIVGVMPQEFRFPFTSRTPFHDASGELDSAPAYWVPIPKSTSAEGSAFTLYSVAARLREGSTVESASRELDALLPQPPRTRRLGVSVVHFGDEEVRTLRPRLLAFQAAALLVLVVSAINFANLFLVRSARYGRDVSTRTALGASPWQANAPMLIEIGLLSLAGGVVGATLAQVIVMTLAAERPALFQAVESAALAPLWLTGLLVSTLVGTAVAGVLLGRALARQKHWRFAAAFRPARLWRAGWAGWPVILQLAAAIALFSTAALLLHSFVRMTRADRGFSHQNILTFRTVLPEGAYVTPAAQNQFARRLQALMEQRLAPATVAAVRGDFRTPSVRARLSVDGRPANPSSAVLRVVSPSFLSLLDVAVMQGRAIEPADVTQAATVAVVNMAFAERYFANADALGHHIKFGDAPAMTIVGIVGNVLSDRLDVAPQPEVYMPPDDTRALSNVTWFVRTPTNATLPADADLRRSVRDIDAEAFMVDAMPLTALLDERGVNDARFSSLVAAVFAFSALALALLGVYGVFSYAVSCRAREFGVRVALGADRGILRRLILREAFVLAVWGGAIGLVAAVSLGGYLKHLLYGVEPHDPATLAAVAITFAACAIGASYIPALRASAVDVVSVLKTQ